MTDIPDRNTPFYWSTFFLRSLLDSRVQHIVISPGSRSTPLTMAAAAHPELDKHVILDERSAAFTALGIGKATNKPAILICTSGTAAANYMPAVIEARKSGLPLIIASADRPPNLRATGANQAIDQLKLFGDYPVLFHEVGEPILQKEDITRLEMLAGQAVTAATQQGGPVHLNFPFRKPLEPTSDFVRRTEKENKKQKIPPKVQSRRSFCPPSGVLKAISSATRPLIITGPTAPSDHLSSVAALAKQLNSPILSESTLLSKFTIQGFAGFLRNKKVRKSLHPDLILRFGFQPTAKSIELALNEWQPKHHFHFQSTQKRQDATLSGSVPVPWQGTELYIDEIQPKQNKPWLSNWKTQEKRFKRYLNNLLEKCSSLTDGVIYSHILPQIKSDHFIAVSNSFPARDLQLFSPGAIRHPLFLSRGASGIDGITSTAIGISLGLQQSGVLFTGDLAFLHDTNALLNHRDVKQNLTIIVINNAGGSIFRMLPIAEHDQYFEEYFETPQSADIQKLADSYNIPCHKIDSLKQLKAFDLQRWQSQQSGLSIIECQTNAEASMKLRKKAWDYP